MWVGEWLGAYMRVCMYVYVCVRACLSVPLTLFVSRPPNSHAFICDVLGEK